MLYERTRRRWRISDEKISKIRFVLSVWRGYIIGVWKPLKWHKVFDERTKKWRKEFDGIQADDEVSEIFFGRKITELLGAQNSVRYFSEKQITSCPKIFPKNDIAIVSKLISGNY